MNAKALIIFLITLISFNFSMKTEMIITGKVTSAFNNSPIEGAEVRLKYTKIYTKTNKKGEFTIKVHDTSSILVVSKEGFNQKEILVGDKRTINIALGIDPNYAPVTTEDALMELADEERAVQRRSNRGRGKKMNATGAVSRKSMAYSGGFAAEPGIPDYNTEDYSPINENIFHNAKNNPLSTFSIDVDAASYSNMRRFLNNGQMPPKDAVRIEEMINYFNYEYEQPKGLTPFSVNTEVSTALWNGDHKLVHIGIQGKDIPTKDLPASNLVFLIDVSGSMSAQNKLPLLKSAFRLLTDQLRPEDKVSIVVYAGAAGLVLEPTSGSEKARIIEAFDKLQAGGSTAGGEGINLAYKIAKENFVKGGNNRVILATDGDFNVGASSNGDMQRLIEEKREDGIFLTALGFGMGNYKDSKMELLADKGNGNYAYIDNILEAKKVLVSEFGGTMFTIAKDVKIQVEFNPAKVQAYRLIGYENRKLNDEDFNDDKKDAGELGSGHTVTALYEIIPVGVESQFLPVDDLKYQSSTVNPASYKSKELMTVKLRYKEPDGDKSKLITETIEDSKLSLEKASDNFKWSASVASFGMLLRDSEFKGTSSYADVIKMAQSAKGADEQGYRIEFINLVKSSQLMAKKE